MASGEPLVRVDHVSRHFEIGGQTIHALQDVSFEVNKGDFVAVIGRSGSGKTTLLNVVAGLDRPSAGHIFIEGEDVAAMNDAQLTAMRRHKIGFVFQSFGLLPLLSAYENVEVALRIAGAGIRERGRRANELLETVGLGRRAHHRPYELSGGEQQRVAIARALANRPALILADEPTGELDSTTANQIFELLLQVVEQEGVTIITTTHDRLVMEKAGRVLELADGALQTGPSYFERDRQQAVHVDVTFAAPTERTETPGRKTEVTTDETPGRKTEVTTDETPEPEEDEPEDAGRWARPGSARSGGLYQPPGPPRAPL